MLRISKLTDAEYVLEQVAGGLEDYYLGKGEAPGVWAGSLAGRFELEGVVGAEELRALIDRVDPDTGAPLAEGAKAARVRAFDATFSAPKSVSLLHALADPATASAVGIADVDAVASALDFLEEKAAVTRRQVAGVRRREATSGWAAATFVHRTSREGDPQLHTHAVIPNLVHRADGTWVALDGSALYRWAKAAGSIYQEQLRRNLTEALGVGWGPDRNGCRELVGISEGQRRMFSKRTAQIEAHLPPPARRRLTPRPGCKPTRPPAWPPGGGRTPTGPRPCWPGGGTTKPPVFSCRLARPSPIRCWPLPPPPRTATQPQGAVRPAGRSRNGGVCS